MRSTIGTHGQRADASPPTIAELGDRVLELDRRRSEIEADLSRAVAAFDAAGVWALMVRCRRSSG